MTLVVVAASEASGALQVSTQVGSRFPALISATGRCIAAFGDYAEEELRERFDTLRWDRPPGYRTWQREVKKTYEPPAIVYREKLEVSAGICPKVIMPCAGTDS